MLENLGGEKLLLILFVIFIFFGGKKIPEIAQGIGKGIREFKKAINDVQEDIKISDKSESKEEKK
jgi:sec-independent protein translocase protein TatA